ncbi:conjugative transfer: assembly [Salmonella enterica subsp. enterica serovar Typhimurium]|nr:conjugative transfer: assembly [Salmonella enterica subsp. enterica serovar Typhimurium]
MKRYLWLCVLILLAGHVPTYRLMRPVKVVL